MSQLIPTFHVLRYFTVAGDFELVASFTDLEHAKVVARIVQDEERKPGISQYRARIVRTEHAATLRDQVHGYGLEALEE